VKAAETTTSSRACTTQVARAPEQSPVQPSNAEPAAGVAVKAIVVPQPTVALHVVPQSTRDGVVVTTPVPPPVRATVTGT
jgi:hypothetical protein